MITFLLIGPVNPFFSVKYVSVAKYENNFHFRTLFFISFYFFFFFGGGGGGVGGLYSHL